MTYQQLIYFREILRTKNITKAAENLFVSRQTISAAINQLEEELGYLLIYREKNGVEMTPDGKLFQERVEQLIDSSEKLIQDMVDYGKKYQIPLHVGLTPCLEYPVYEALGNWELKHPEVRLVREEVSGARSTERLLDGSLDCVFTLMPNYANPGFVTELLAEYELCLAVHKDNPLAAKKVIDDEDLLSCTMLSSTLGYGKMEYTGKQFMPFDDMTQSIFYSEDTLLLYSALQYDKGVLFCHKNAPVSHLDYVRVIPFSKEYTYPIFMRTSNHTMKKQEYDRIIQDLKRTMKSNLT